MTAAPKEVASPYVSSARFWVMCEGWSVGLGFSKLAGFQSEVEAQEYSYNGRIGNVHTKQFGRPKPPSVTLERALDAAGFAQLFSWHTLARMNNPLAKLPASFTIMSASGVPSVACLLENAWCSKIEIDPTEAGAATVVKMKVTIVCDSIMLV